MNTYIYKIYIYTLYLFDHNTALNLNLIDLCIGPYINESLPSSLPSSTELYKEHFILVVRPKKSSIKEYFLMPYRPFHWKVRYYTFIMLDSPKTYSYSALIYF